MINVERRRTRDVVEDFDVANLLPRHGHVLEQLENSVRHVLEGAQIDALVVAELAVRHVAVVADDLAHVLRWHVLLLRVDEAELALVSVALGLQLLPLARLLLQLRLRRRAVAGRRVPRRRSHRWSGRLHLRVDLSLRRLDGVYLGRLQLRCCLSLRLELGCSGQLGLGLLLGLGHHSGVGPGVGRRDEERWYPRHGTVFDAGLWWTRSVS